MSNPKAELAAVIADALNEWARQHQSFNAEATIYAHDGEEFVDVDYQGKQLTINVTGSFGEEA
jgi:hypothetical protein